jgi:hypothetical protein
MQSAMQSATRSFTADSHVEQFRFVRLLGFLESVPEVASKLKDPNTLDMQSAEVVEMAKAAAVLVLVY